MNYRQMQNIYKANRLDHYRLESTEDLLKIHGINYKEVDGYNELDDDSKDLYREFIVKIFNVTGLDSRSTLIPKGIRHVEEIEQVIEKSNDNGDKYYLTVGSVVNAVDRNGMKLVLHTWRSEDYKEEEVINSEPKYYLRFEYEHDKRKAYLNVVSPTEWY